MKHTRIILVLLLSLFMFTACNTNNENPDDSDDKQEENNQNQFEYEAPVLTLTDRTVTWELVMGNVQYEILVNGETIIYQNHVTDYYLNETSTFKMRIIDIYKNPLSDWSNEITYTEPPKVYYTVTFKSPEGYFEDFEKEYIVGENYGVPTPEVAGYTFIGWYFDEVYTEETKLYFSIPYSVTTDTVMYAKFKANDYYVTYNEYSSWVEFYSEGKRIESNSVGGGTNTLDYPKQPKRDGYIFTGWYKDEECTELYPTTSYVTEDISLYAGWFDEDNLMFSDSDNNYGNDWGVTEYYGWNSEVKVKVHNGASILGPVSMSFTVWDERTYQLEYRILDVNGKCTMYFVDEINKKILAKVYPDFSTEFESIEFYGIPGNVYTVYMFDASSDPEVELQIPDIKPEVFPHAPNKLRVTYNEHFKLPVIEKENLQFYGYYTEKNGQGTQITDGDGNSLVPYNFSSDTTIYPFYSDITYNINYEANGGVLANDNSYITSFTEKDLPITLPTLTKPGCTFDGWFDNIEFNGEALTSITNVSERNINLYAKFTEIDYKLNTYLGSHDSNPELVKEEVIHYNETHSLLDTIKDGYEITGYYYLENENPISLEKDFIYLFENDLNVYINYKPIEYTITYHTDGGCTNDGETLKSSYNITEEYALPLLTKENYVFNGWYDNSEFNGEEIKSINLGTTGNKEFYAKFTPREYKISVYFGRHNSYEPKLVEEINLYYNDEYSLNKNIVDGYIITGYYYLFSDGSDMAFESSGVYNYTDDMVLYTFTDTIPYDITYHMNEGSLNENDILTYKYNINSYIMLPSLNKYGYVFEGWYDNEAFNGNSINAIEPGRSGNLDLYAKFTQYTYEIKVDGSAYNLEDLSIDVIYTLDFSIPFEVVEGAQFKGYYFAPNGEGGKVCDSNGNSVHVYDWNESITIYPYYIADSFSITYIYPGGSMEPEPVYYYTVFDDIIVLPTVYYLDYKFLGWYTDSEFTSERIDTIDPKSMQTYTLYAKCEVVYYNCHIAYENIVVTFDLQYDDKKIIQTIDYASGQYTFEYPEHPVREGYIFGGWYKTPECGDNDKIYLTSFPRNNLTIYAKWIEIPEAISSEVYEIVHLDFTDYNSNKPLTYTISENCTADKPTLFFMLLDPAEDYSHVNIKGTSNTNVSIGTFGWDNTYYEGQNFTLTQDYTTVSLYTMKYSILMVYVYGNGSKFDINLYVDGMYEFETIDVCNKLIKHNERLVVLDKYGDYVLEGIYTEPNCQGERISSDWEVFSKYLYEGLVVYPHYVLVEE